MLRPKLLTQEISSNIDNIIYYTTSAAHLDDTSKKWEWLFQMTKKQFITKMHNATQMLLIDDSLLSNTRPLNYQIYYKIYERYSNRMLEIEQRTNELRNEEYNLINEQRRLDKARDMIKEKIIGTSGVHIFKENHKRQKMEQKEERQVPNHFPQSHNTNIQ